MGDYGQFKSGTYQSYSQPITNQNSPNISRPQTTQNMKSLARDSSIINEGSQIYNYQSLSSSTKDAFRIRNSQDISKKQLIDKFGKTDRTQTQQTRSHTQQGQRRIKQKSQGSINLQIKNLVNHTVDIRNDANRTASQTEQSMYFNPQLQVSTKRTTAHQETSNPSFTIRMKSGTALKKPMSVTGRFTADSSDPDALLKRANNKLEFARSCIQSIQDVKLVDEDVTQLLKSVVSHLNISLDKAYSRFLLNPTTEVQVIDALVETEVAFIKLVRSVTKEYNKQKQRADGMVDDVQKYANEAEEAKKNQEKQYWDLKVALSVPESEREYQKLALELKNKLEKNERIWAVEKHRFQSEVQTLKQQIKDIENQTLYQELKNEYEKYKEKMVYKLSILEQAYEKKTNRTYKLEMDLSTEKANRQDIQAQYERLEGKYNQMIQEHNEAINEFELFQEELVMYRESYLMAREDDIHKDFKLAKINDEYKKISGKYYSLQIRADKLQKESEKYTGINQQEYDIQSGMLRPIKSVFQGLKKPLLFTNLTTIDKGIDFAGDNLNLGRFSLYKPNFIVFVDHGIQEKLANPLAENQLISDKELFVMIRAMFDSKYNEYLYYDNPKLFTGFPEFVYGWLSTFTVDSISKTVRAIGYQDHIDIQQRRINLQHALLNDKLSKAWDVEVFKDFLEERYNPDEIFFYLHCRHIFYNGSQLDNFDSAFSIVQWVQLERVDYFLQFMMSKMEKDSIKSILQLLKQRAKYKHGKLFVDVSYVFKLLLEHYRQEKKQVYAQLQEAFVKLIATDSNKKQYIPFDSFNMFMQEKFTFTNDTERAAIYRQAWCIGNGVVDLESFFIAASEYGLFTKNIKRILLSDYSVTSIMGTNSAKKDIIIEENAILTDFIKEKYGELRTLFTKCKKFASNLGLDQLDLEINELERDLMIHHDHNMGTKGDQFYLQFSKLMQTFTQAKNHYFLAHKNSLGSDKQIIEMDLKGFEMVLAQVEFYAGLDEASWLSKMNKVKRLQAFCKKKMSIWYQTLAKLKIKIKEDKKTAERSKLNMLRSPQKKETKRMTVRMEKKNLETFGQKMKEQTKNR